VHVGDDRAELARDESVTIKAFLGSNRTRSILNKCIALISPFQSRSLVRHGDNSSSGWQDPAPFH